MLRSIRARLRYEPGENLLFEHIYSIARVVLKGNRFRLVLVLFLAGRQVASHHFVCDPSPILPEHLGFRLPVLFARLYWPR